MKVAVVGLGHFGPGRLDALARRSEVSALVACDHHPHKLEAVASRHPAAALESSYARVLDDPSVDAVVLSTPIVTHAELGLAALEAGKHLLVEKPLATSVREAERLVETARRRGLVLMVGHTFEHGPAARAMTERMTEGALGPLLYASFRRVNLGRHQRDSSVLWDLAIHDVSLLLRWRARAPRSVTFTGRNVLSERGPELGFLQLGWEDGFVASVESSWIAPEKRRLVQVVGARASLEYDAGETFERLRVFDRRAARRGDEVVYHWGEAREVSLAGASAVDRELEVFLERVRRGAWSEAEAGHALRVVEVLESAAHARAPR